MLYLIGGPPKCGKTTLAKQLSKSASIPWVSTDTLQNVIKPYIPEQFFATKFPSSAMRYASNDKKYSNHSAIEIIDAYRQQAQTVHAAIEAFVASEIADGNDYIIEGFHIEPELINKLSEKFPGKVRGLLVVKKDSTAFIESIRQSSTPNDWIIARTKDETTFPKIASMVIEYGSQLEDEVKNKNIKVYIVDENFDAKLQEAESYLLGTV